MSVLLPTISLMAQDATIHNFARPDILDGNDGMPPSPFSPLIYGAPVLHIDNLGNGVEEHTAKIYYFEGKYYMYAEKWGCGKIVVFSGRIPGNPETPQRMPPSQNVGQCGLATYVSDDLMNWKMVNIFTPEVPDDPHASASKPHVLYNKKTKQYVMWLKAGSNFATKGGFSYVTSNSPAGPWSDLKVCTGDHMGHDFDIAMGSDGKAYLLSDPFSGEYDKDSPGGKKPNWDVYIQQLNDEMTGTTGDSSKCKLILHNTDYEALGLFEYKGKWYATGGPTCGNCEVPIKYVMADSPFGVWTNEEGDTGDKLTDGTVIAADGITGQNKGSNILPTPNGTIIVEGIWGYRTNPNSYASNGRVNHGNNSQAISSTYWYPLKFDEAGHIKPIKGTASVTIPLMNKVDSKPIPPYQPDVRIRKDTVIEQTGITVPEDGKFALSIFQNTDEISPFKQAANILDEPLIITLTFSDGKQQVISKSSDEFGFSPTRIEIKVNKKYLKNNVTLSSISLKSDCTVGAYGVIVEPNKISGGEYITITPAGKRVNTKAQLSIF